MSRYHSLTSSAVDGDLVWSLSGGRTGPDLLVTGPEAAMRAAARLLQAVPSLSYMRGRIAFAATSSAIDADLHVCLDNSQPRDAYWRILAAATSLGMISGRGVPAAYLQQQVA